MFLFSFFRISKPRAQKVPEGAVDATYRRLRRRTFWGVTAVYTLYYICRGTLSVVKQPLIDGGVLTAGQLGIIGSAFLFVYAAGKFMNGFIADLVKLSRKEHEILAEIVKQKNLILETEISNYLESL